MPKNTKINIFLKILIDYKSQFNFQLFLTIMKMSFKIKNLSLKFIILHVYDIIIKFPNMI